MKLIYLAAGRGSRLPIKFRKLPKCLTKISNLSLFEHQIGFFKQFKNKIIITGYKSKSLKDYIIKNNFFEIKNDNYKSTNMVHSMFLAAKYITNDVVICYGDILFKKSISKNFSNKGNIMPVYTNWLWYWRKRMNKKMILSDAEDLIVYKKNIRSIGNKIKKKLPKYQYMGIFKLDCKTFKNMNLYYKKLKNKKIDMTSFLDLCIQNKILKIKMMKYSNYWFEIDTHEDIKVAKKLFN